nr:MAG TPA: hypothetical protein [Ackermannviridae sp.]
MYLFKYVYLFYNSSALYSIILSMSELISFITSSAFPLTKRCCSLYLKKLSLISNSL